MSTNNFCIPIDSFIFVLPQRLLSFFYACIVTMAEASYSNCPKVSVSIVTQRSGCRFRDYLRARLPQRTVPPFLRAFNNPRPLDAGGKKRFSKRTGKDYFYFAAVRAPFKNINYNAFFSNYFKRLFFMQF